MITTILILAVVLYFYKGSKSYFFYKSREDLADYRHKMIMLLIYKGRTEAEIEFYKNAYDFFCKYPAKFDGATIVKDLEDLPKLDLDAMVHDYECLIGSNRNFKLWFKSAWNYFENMRKNGKGNQVLRLIGLSIIGLFFVPYCYFFTKPYNNL
jgi:hypothetical protein